MKLVISDQKSGKSYQVVIPKESENMFIGVKIGDTVDVGFAGAPGYKGQITGGSDKDGFPMRRDISGSRRGHFLLSSGTGFNPKRKGERKRKMVHGNTIGEGIMQINMKITEYGEKPLEELFAKKEEENKKE
ncbi:MAG: 30S ribosomal protein S6e [Candidatus Micrarchaeota archaeon]